MRVPSPEPSASWRVSKTARPRRWLGGGAAAEEIETAWESPEESEEPAAAEEEALESESAIATPSGAAPKVGGAAAAARVVFLRGASDGERLKSRPRFALDGGLMGSILVGGWGGEGKGGGGYSAMLYKGW